MTKHILRIHGLGDPRFVHLEADVRELFAIGKALEDSPMPVYVMSRTDSGDETGFHPLNKAARNEME